MHVVYACICDTYLTVCANDMHSLVRCVQHVGLLWMNADPVAMITMADQASCWLIISLSEDLWSQLTASEYHVRPGKLG